MMVDSEREEGGWLEQSVVLALKSRVLILFALALFVAAGAWSFNRLPIDAVPDVSNVQVTVTVSARGFAPREVESYVTFPVELALQNLPKLEQLRSISKFSLCQVTAVFQDGTDLYWARQQVQERLGKASRQMPPGNEIEIMLGPIATGLGEVFQFEVRGDGFSQMELRDILDWQIAPSLNSVPGVDTVESMGGQVREYQVLLEPERMHGFEISASDVMQALRQNNNNSGGGYSVEGDEQRLIRGEAMLRTTDDIANVVIRRSAAGVVKVRDVGAVRIGCKQAQSIVTRNGIGETVIGIVIMRKGENSRILLDRLHEKIDAISRSLPEGVDIVPFYDRSRLVDQTIETVWHNLQHGAILVILVLFVVLGDVRSALVAAIAIPLSLLGSIGFLAATGASGNLLSLGAIDFGILIDGTVVMVENIMRRLAMARGRNRLSTVLAASVEVARPVFFAVLIITVVYLPILGLPGVSGRTFQPMALTVVFGLLTALVVALLVTPTLSYFILPGRPSEEDSRFIALLRKPYAWLLHISVKHPLAASLLSIAAVLASLALVPGMGSEFIPVLKEGSTVLTVNRPVSGSLDIAAEQTSLIEKVARECPDVERVVSRTGHSEIAFDPMGPDESDTFIILKPPEEWRTGRTQQEIEDRITERIRRSVPGCIFSVSQPVEQRMNELIAGAKSDVAIRIFGTDLATLRRVGERVGKVVKSVEGAADVKLEQTAGLPVITARLDSSKLAAYGVRSQEALDAIAAARSGKVVGTIYKGKPRYDLVVKFDPEHVSEDGLGELPVVASNGALIPLAQIASVVEEGDVAQIGHREGDRVFTVQLNVKDRDLGGFIDDARDAVARQVSLPPGYRISWGGQFENLAESRDRLIVLVPLALLLIFMLLYASFGAAKPGLLIFANIPLSISGGLAALWLRGMPLSVTAAVGFIALFGVAVLNGVVLVSTIRQLELEASLAPRLAAMVAARQRLRPVLMTALVASLGFLPMAMATSVGAEVQRPLATVVIGGLVTSTILTLLIIPALYPLFCGVRKTNLPFTAKDSNEAIDYQEKTAQLH